MDNYGTMEIKNWTTGEVCIIDFKQRGWKASSAYQVFGKVVGADGMTKWSIGGRWNDKIYARVTEGFEDQAVGDARAQATSKSQDKQQAFLVWEAHKRPQGIPFNLTPFVVTLNAVPESLRHHLPPTDTRLRPDQRAMEDGAYDHAATEKNRVEEKQRAARRKRENSGDEFKPKWFSKKTDPTTGESYWDNNGLYWKQRAQKDWTLCDDIFSVVLRYRRRKTVETGVKSCKLDWQTTHASSHYAAGQMSITSLEFFQSFVHPQAYSMPAFTNDLCSAGS